MKHIQPAKIAIIHLQQYDICCNNSVRTISFKGYVDESWNNNPNSRMYDVDEEGGFYDN